ncbi:hypothetical protein GCM10023328_23810 [Modestobacter marinus]|uniref:Polysaccharide pyruvyl transferase WcaK-like protein n=1 Tax=Modestobacter marinus TaxID=477641 RepID=A0A846LK04_9ACTN|nr:polysaccharide pyruvyl transferase family protein [Modestobacter marinus]NIH66362.1 polysaccharide pyruvyl transferase WcaK-like protein [Modestobacter marinus]GGL63029.1 hypothetical protein GCM10011589_19070 [Modestobacter marinus]
MTKAIERAHRIWRRAVVASGLPSLVDRRIIRSRVRAEPRVRGRHLLLAAPGGGNVGDQAMLESVLENTAGPVTLVVPDPAAVELPEEFRQRVEVLEIPHLVYGTGADHRASVAAFGRALAGAAQLSVLGADVMDGRYSLPASVRRSNLARAAARAGVDTRIIGFSWSDRARVAARRSLAGAARDGVRLLLRDPISAERARADGIAPVEEVADVVFAARTVDGSAADELLRDVTRPVALVNVSGLLADRVDQTEEYVRIVEHLRGRGLHVLVIPHVDREQSGDMAPCAALMARVGELPDVSGVPSILSPAQVRGLTARASVTVTGRMHLAVMSLLNGVPALTLASQGKVEGLMQLFGTPELRIDAVPGFSAVVAEVIDRVLPEDSAARQSIRQALPGVVAMGQRNTADLLASVPTGQA